MAKRIIEVTIDGLSNEDAETGGEQMDIKIEKVLKDAGFSAEVTDEIDIECDDEDSDIKE